MEGVIEFGFWGKIVYYIVNLNSFVNVRFLRGIVFILFSI